MNPRRNPEPTTSRPEVEFPVFLLVSALGVYSLGQGLLGLFEAGHRIDLLWLAVTGGAMLILIAQMARVHDTWPRRDSGVARASIEVAEPEQPTEATER